MSRTIFKISNKMKKIIQKSISSVVLLLFIFNISYGQNYMEDIVYLKNGSVIRGLIIEQVPNVNIKIQTTDRNIFVFKIDEIEKMTKENNSNLSDNSKINSKVNNEVKITFINLTENNFNPGIGYVKVGNSSIKNQDFSFGFRTVNGIKINEHFSLGIGIGIDKYKYATLLPITLDTRVSILKGKTSPVISNSIGYSISLNDINGGLVINPQIGIRTYISKNVAYLFNVGYKWQALPLQVLNYDYYNSGITSVSTTSAVYFHQFFTISTGLSF